MLEKYLQEIGLSEKEAQMYLALLQVDSESIQELAKRTGINRTTVYPVLETLKKKGLVSEIQIGKKTYYSAASPERLETFIERQKVLLEEKSRRINDIIPELKAVQRSGGERPIIKFFEGRDGVVSAYEEFYGSFNDTEQEGYMIYNRDLVQDTYSEKEIKQFQKIRLGKKVKPVSVYNNASGDYTFDTPGLRTRIDGEKYPIFTDITVIRDTVILSTLGDYTSSFIIKSTDIAETLKSLVKYINETR